MCKKYCKHTPDGEASDLSSCSCIVTTDTTLTRLYCSNIWCWHNLLTVRDTSSKDPQGKYWHGERERGGEEVRRAAPQMFVRWGKKTCKLIFVVQICCKNASNCFEFISITVRNQIRHKHQQTSETKRGQVGKELRLHNSAKRKT